MLAGAKTQSVRRQHVCRTVRFPFLHLLERARLVKASGVADFEDALEACGWCERSLGPVEAIEQGPPVN